MYFMYVYIHIWHINALIYEHIPTHLYIYTNLYTYIYIYKYIIILILNVSILNVNVSIGYHTQNDFQNIFVINEYAI